MKSLLFSPLTQAPPARSFWQDFFLLVKTQFLLYKNRLKQISRGQRMVSLTIFLLLAFSLAFIGRLLYGKLMDIPPLMVSGILPTIFLLGITVQLFFGVTAAFNIFYASKDLELLFVAPVSSKAVFASKTFYVMNSTLLPTVFFIFLPGLFYGLLLGVSLFYYLWLLPVLLGLWALGSALASFLNIAIMRIVPPHRSKEAAGVLSIVTSLLFVVLYNLPMLLSGNKNIKDLAALIAAQENLIKVMNYFPWGWAGRALALGANNAHGKALGWSMAVLGLGLAIFLMALSLVEKGFRRGWLAISRGEGGRRRVRKKKVSRELVPPGKPKEGLLNINIAPSPAIASPLQGIWAVAKKDFLYIKRDVREWMNLLLPIIIPALLVLGAVFYPESGAQGYLINLLIIYSIFSANNLALKAFSREGEAEWLLNSVPLAGWPVVWGKFIGAAVPSLVIFGFLLVMAFIVFNFTLKIIVLLAGGGVLVVLASLAIGLYYSITNCRYNPDSPHAQTTAPISMVLYEFAFAGALAAMFFFFIETFIKHPLWQLVVFFSIAIPFWGLVFFGFMKAVVNQSLKGFRVEISKTPARKSSFFGRL